MQQCLSDRAALREVIIKVTRSENCSVSRSLFNTIKCLTMTVRLPLLKMAEQPPVKCVCVFTLHGLRHQTKWVSQQQGRWVQFEFSTQIKLLGLLLHYYKQHESAEQCTQKRFKCILPVHRKYKVEKHQTLKVDLVKTSVSSQLFCR